MEEISPERCFTLVGRFMFEWALIERQVDNVITAAFNFTLLQSTLITITLSVEQKIDVMARLTNLSSLGESHKIHYKVVMKDLSDLKNIRNIVAHCVFFPTDNKKAVKFLRVKKGKGTLQFPLEEWSEEDFLNHFEKLHISTTELKLLEVKLKQAKSHKSLIEALSGTQTDPF